MSHCAPYLQAPGVSFYQPTYANHYDNYTNHTLAQNLQLNRASLMPKTTAHQPHHPADPTASWYKYAPTTRALDQYILAAGDVRHGISSRSNLSKLGMPNLLRTQPPAPVRTGVAFQDSSIRLDLAKDAGCGYQGY